MSVGNCGSRSLVFDSMRAADSRWLLQGVGIVVWLTMVAYGFFVYALFEYRSASTRPIPVRWPADSRIARDAGKPTLLMFLHPRCPCSFASLAELQELLRELPSTAITTRILMTWPDKVSDDWDDTSLRSEAAVAAGSATIADHDAAETRRFCASTSGECFLYDTDGQLLFHGGLVGGRNNMAAVNIRTTIADILTRPARQPIECPAFGCPLLDHHESVR